jgi:hypothetical protein
MSRITTVNASYKLTRNLGDYNNVSPSVGMTATVEENEDPVEVERGLMAACKAEVHEVVKAILAEQEEQDSGRPRRR